MGGALTHPAHAVGAHRRSEFTVWNIVGHIQAREEYLLDHLAGRIAQLGFERHGRFLIQPEAIPEPELILRCNGHDSRSSAEYMRRRQRFDSVEVVHIRAELRQRSQKGTVIRPGLHQHRVLIG